MKREEIASQYKWDIESLYAAPQDTQADLALAVQQLDLLAAMKGHLTDSEATLLQFFELSETFDRLLSKLYVYAKQQADVDPKNPEIQDVLAKATNVLHQSSQKLAFVQPELVGKAKKLQRWINKRVFKDFRFDMEKIIREAPHTNTPEVEELLGRVQAFAGQSQETFTTIRLDFKPVQVNGKEEFLNAATYSLFMENKDRSVRRQAFDNFLGEYKKWSNTFASTLAGHIKSTAFFAKESKFANSLEASLHADNVDQVLFDQVLKAANETYHHYYVDYLQLVKDRSGLEPIYTYDLSVPMVEDVDLKFSIEEAQKITKKALKPLGANYGKILQKAFDERWIDYHTHEGKRVGAYSWGCYDSHPFIMMNWVGNYDSLSTLVHELGHSMHTYFSNGNNRASNSHYRIFVAEVASTVNEVLLINHLLKKYESNPKVKAYLLNKFIVEMIGTMYRQPFFADFEASLFNHYEQGNALSNKYITDTYLQKTRAYYGPAITVPDEVAYHCYLVPHFYYRFYVYKYTVGIVCALAIAKRILAGDKAQVKSYLNFLKSGGTKWPVELLKGAHVDPTANQVYDDAFNYFGEVVDQFKQALHQLG